ncbi:MAG: hypothetical protein U0359_41720 [Byssovorax sp.]
MTSSIAWVGADSRGPASLYLASDSRITWDGEPQRWNLGRKLFASRTTPDIFGYVGQVEFSLHLVGRLVDGLESGVVPANPYDASRRCVIIQRQLEEAFLQLPITQQRYTLILYGAREGHGMTCSFRLWKVELSRTGCIVTSLDIPTTSSVLVVEGSGAPAMEPWQLRWERTSQGGTSRAVFSAFCDALAEGRDSHSGGAPQLVGLYRVGPGHTFGLIHEGKAWFNGGLVDREVALGAHDIEWRNRLLERCNGDGTPFEDAQRHHAPKGLGGRGKMRG